MKNENTNSSLALEDITCLTDPKSAASYLHAYYCYALELTLPSIESSSHNNFFALGGDSLQASKMVSRLNHELSSSNIQISLTEFFEHPTLHELSVLLTKKHLYAQTFAL